MSQQQLIGVAVPSDSVASALEMIERAEQLGIAAAWMTTGMARPDNLTTFAAAAVRTQRIKLGTSIVPTFPRHPLVTVQQTQVIAHLAPGRFRLGIGPTSAVLASRHPGAPERVAGPETAIAWPRRCLWSSGLG